MTQTIGEFAMTSHYNFVESLSKLEEKFQTPLIENTLMLYALNKEMNLIDGSGCILNYPRKFHVNEENLTWDNALVIC